MQLVPENVTSHHRTMLSPPISMPASAHLNLPFNSPGNIQYTTPVNIPSNETLGQRWDGSDDYLPALGTRARVRPQVQSYAPYLEPGNYTTPTHDPANGSNDVYLGSLGYNSFASHCSRQPNNVPPAVIWVPPPRSGYEVEGDLRGSAVTSGHDKSGTVIYGTSSSEFSMGDNSLRRWNPSRLLLNPLLPVTSVSAPVSASSFGTTGGSSCVNHELKRNDVVDLELTGFFGPASSVIASGKDVGRHSQHRHWIFTRNHQGVHEVDGVSHHLAHLNLKEWKCTCGSTFSSRYNGTRHIKEFTPCSTCHKKIGRHGKDSLCKSCLA